ncbi:hypothetical protein FRB94_009068 [Tulasnella sp. JGI-2019a]|nr:hypothetical protein FRB93_001690 [Tulasnella sp. JGI-2019a]KAG9011142.1 hypothetical protein FRB94_009068 [Tulasnella sp. JGI-2019a]
MNYDSHRRFVFGFTIEDAWPRMWYCDRAGFLVSDKVKIIGNAPQLVQIFVALSIATPKELGSIQLVCHDREAQFRINVSGTAQYLTEAILPNPRTAGAVIGQAARVWSVRELNADGEPFGDVLALKDVWVRQGYPREGDIIRAIMEQATDDPVPTATRNEFIAHLIGIKVHGEVKTSGDSDTIFRNRRGHIFELPGGNGYPSLSRTWFSSKPSPRGSPLASGGFGLSVLRPIFQQVSAIEYITVLSTRRWREYSIS